MSTFGKKYLNYWPYRFILSVKENTDVFSFCDEFKNSIKNPPF